MAVKLWEVAKLVRSKNAGPFKLTFDILFDSRDSYERVKRSGVLNSALFSRIYRVPVEQVQFFEHDLALAIKASIPRSTFCGDLDDTDVFGCQMHGPLVNLDVPV